MYYVCPTDAWIPLIVAWKLSATSTVPLKYVACQEQMSISEEIYILYWHLVIRLLSRGTWINDTI
jgi:hypothetical protein